tara:strand:+ start:842 stop:1024 length:183 start_codon:yes stop_codon:yes gene_type:complete
MDSIDLADKIKRTIKSRREQIRDTLMDGGIENMDQYKYLQGELTALYYVEESIKDFFGEK